MERYYIIKEGVKIFFYKMTGETKVYATNPQKIGNYMVYNPTEQMLLDDNWIEEPEEPHVRTLEEAKDEKVNDARDYANSDAIKVFYLDNTGMWFDSEERSSLWRRFDSEESAGKTDTKIWWENLAHVMPITNAKSILNSVENYAASSYDNTEVHIRTINTLQKVEQVDSYDFTTGYPEKLYFTSTSVQSESEVTMPI